MNALRHVLSLLLLAPLLLGCWKSSDDPPPPPPVEIVPGQITSEPLTPASGPSKALFTPLPTDETGLDFVNVIDNTHPMRYLFASAMGCGGVAIGDVDGDGRPDVYLTSGPRGNRLYRQVDRLKFEDVTAAAVVDGGGAWSVSASMADVDGDGDLDIYVCNYDSPNLLFVNQGDGTFSEQAKSFGIDFIDAGHTATFCDYDRDGDLDFYLMTNFYYDPRGKTFEPIVARINGRPTVLPKFQKYYGITKVSPGKVPGTQSVVTSPVGRADRLVRNNGDGTFSDVSDEAGIEGVGKGNSAIWWDYNEDGWPDLYVGNDFQDPDRLYRNNGDGTFRDVIEPMVPHTTWYSMGADFADLDGDGAADFVIADMSGTNHFKQKTAMGAMSASAEFLNTAVPRQYMRNVVYLNSRGGPFMEAAHLAGLANSDWTWSVRLADFDNDGRPDVFFTNGMARNLNVADNEAAANVLPGETEWDKHIRAKTPALREQNLAFRNLGDLRFADVSKPWGLDHVGMSYAAATADLDRDGDLDLVVANLEEPVSIYRNDSAAGHRLLIRLMGTTSNRWGLGSKLRIETASGVQVRELTPVRGYMASNEPLVHFGLGEDEMIQRLTVRWPSGHVQTFDDLAGDRFYTIAEPAGPPPEPPSSEPRPAMFLRSEALTDVAHREQPYDDFKRQPLLPNKYSQLGPGTAWGDIDGDGDDDLWVGGAKGQSGRLYRNDGGGKFTFSSFSPWSDDRLHEDMAGVWLDAEGDGDLDLYVVSGGVECEPGDALLQDRLYLNDGKGHFSKAPEDALPKVRDSGGVVTAADFDGDGDVDLFVGGRIIPGKYPLSPRSRLLRNDGGRFSDATAELAPALQQTGLVTGAVWSDADGDGWVDLLVTHEWGPVKLFHNDRGRLVDKTAEAGLAKRLGWWNGIAATDVDNDGDIDYAVTNFGLNTKYHASPKRPTLLYYGDFDQRGIMTIVEAEYENETLFPVRGKSCSTRAMPHLADKFTSFNAFALADLAKIYTPKCLSESHRYEANALESGVLINDGAGRFSFRPLPRLAQIAPGFGIVATDIDGDGNVDLYMVQNFYGPQAETGRMAGGVSLLLRGRGDGSFVAVPPRESGLIVPGDAKSLTTTDLNGDGRVDFVVGVNDDKLLAFQRQTSNGNGRVLSVKLRGIAGNPQAVGARVKLIRSAEVAQIAEVHAGSGYLSQSSTTIIFGLGEAAAERIEVVWPDGKRTTHTPTAGSDSMTIQQPGS